MTPSFIPWTWCISPSYSSSTRAYWWLWPPEFVRWNLPSAATQEPQQWLRQGLGSSMNPARTASLCWVLPAWWGPPGAWPFWAQDTPATQYSTSSASSTLYKVCWHFSMVFVSVQGCLFFLIMFDQVKTKLLKYCDVCFFVKVSSSSCGSVCQPRSRGREKWRKEGVQLQWGLQRSKAISASPPHCY